MNSAKLIVLTGFQGSGKSTVAQLLAKRLAAPVLSVDPIESAILKTGIHKSFETGYAAYLVAHDIAKEQLTLGMTVIVDASNYIKEAHAMWEALAAGQSAELIVVECICSDESLHRKRLKQRVRGLTGFKEITWEDVQKRKQEAQPWNIDKIVIDTATDIESQIDNIIARVR